MQTATLPFVSAIAAGVLILGQMALMLAVARVRRTARVSLGNGEDPALLAAIRRHGNYAENAAIFVAGLALLETLGAERSSVIQLAAIFIGGRVLHAIGLSQTKTVNLWRIAGIVATVAAGVGLGAQLIALGLPHLR